MAKETRTESIGDMTYYIVYEETEHYQRVSVYDKELDNYYTDSNDIVYRKEKKSTRFTFWRGSVTPVEKFIREAIMDAHNEVTSREDAVDRAVESAAEAFNES